MTIEEKAKEYQIEYVPFLTGKGGATNIISAYIAGAQESSLNKLAQEIYKNAKAKGFYENQPECGTRLMLVVSELVEALEASYHSKHYKNAEVCIISERG